jgi:hypothetical protein
MLTGAWIQPDGPGDVVVKGMVTNMIRTFTTRKMALGHRTSAGETNRKDEEAASGQNGYGKLQIHSFS